MKTRIFLIIVINIICFYYSQIFAQPWMSEPYLNSSDKNNIKKIENAFNNYWQGKAIEKGSGYKQFKTFLNYWRTRSDKNGNMPSAGFLLQQRALMQNQTTAKSNSANWTPMGPSITPGTPYSEKVPGVGRVNVVRFHPADTNIMWIGTAAAGVWKTVNGGASWTMLNMSDYANCAVSDIAVNPVNPNIIYVATGDSKIGALKSYGVLKTIDGGNTWVNTTSFFLNANQLIYRLLIHPTNPDIVFMSCGWSNIYKTTDGGANWNYIPGSSSFKDMQFKPDDPNTVYGIDGAGQFYKSTDCGSTFSHITNGLPSTGAANSVIAVTSANPSIVYAHITSSTTNATLGVYKSIDSGNSFSLVHSSTNLVQENGTFMNNSLGFYVLFLAVSPTNENEVLTGGMHIFRSIDGGSNFSIRTKYNTDAQSGVVSGFHTDVHYVAYVPGSNTIMPCTDAGIFKIYNNSTSYVDLNNTLMISQVYKITGCESMPGLLLAGLQDDHVIKYDGSSWAPVVAGDGMECIINNSNPNILYMTVQNGYMFKSINGGQTYYSIAPAGQSGNGTWTIPFVSNPQNQNELFAGYKEVFKSINGGESWTQITSNQSAGAEIIGLAVNNGGTHIFASTLNKLFRSTNSGGAWTEITGTLPVAEAFIWNIYVEPSNAQNVWVIFGGTAAGKKVYKSNNGGNTWTNISGTLPNVKINCILPDHQSIDQTIYVGTDLGVFYLDNTTNNDWVAFNNNLPNISVTDLELNHTTGKLRAGTYGRSVWETSIQTVLSSPDALPCEYKVNFPEIGHNSFTVFSNNGNAGAATECAELFSTDNSFTHVMGATFDFCKAVTNNPSTGKITVKVWLNDGIGGKPGTVVAQKDVLISQIASNITNLLPTEVVFDNPVEINSPYYIGYSANYVAGDTIGIKSSWYGQTAANTAFVFSGGSWTDYIYWGTLSMATTAVVGIIPTPEFAANTTTGNTGAVINFTNQSQNGSAYLWRFQGGNPQESTDINPSITYNQAGIFPVTLISYGSCNGVDSLVRTNYITISEPEQFCYKTPALTGSFITQAPGIAPDAAFNANTTTILSGGNVSFTDHTLNNPTSWAWTFYGGTPSTSTIQNPTGIVYSTAGVYNVRLIATNAFGTDTLIKSNYITVNPAGTAPIANFTANPTTITAGGTVNFTDNSANNPTSWTWTFDGGTPSTSNVQNPTGIVYSTPGTYNVTLVATNAFGTNTKVKTTYIIVNPAGSAPVANFTANLISVVAGNSINFTDNSTNTPTSWTWTFTGGTPSTANVQNPTGIVYNTPGTYDVTLVATNAFGTNTKVKSAYITVTPAGVAPIANFTASLTNIIAGNSIDFTDNSTNTPTFWSWTFTGGTPSTANVQNPTGIVYNTPGTYNVTLVATNAFGTNTKVKSAYITVTPAGVAPIANFTASQTVITAGNSIGFTDNSTNTPTSWSWTFTGGTPSTANVQNPTGIVYNTPGTYNVTLVATNAFGTNTKVKSAYITVNPAGLPPVAAFTADQTTIFTNGTVNFTDNTTHNPSSWLWTFDGGTPSTSNLQNPVIVYNTDGTYNVTLMVYNSFGGDTLIQNGYINVVSPATVINDNCSGAITLVHETACNPVNGTTVGATESIPAIDCGGFTGTADDDVWYQFVATSSTADIIVDGGTLDLVVELLSGSCNGTNEGCADSYTGGVETISATGLTIGATYLVRVYSYDNSTGTFTICVSGSTAGNPPQADFTSDLITVSEGETVNYTDQSTNTPTSWLWTFEGGTPSTSSDQNPSVVYNTAGIYDVKLVATNTDGSDSILQTGYITVNFSTAAPYADFSSDFIGVYEGETVNFTDYSTGSPTSWLWTFEGGTPSTSSDQNPSVVYNTAGTYAVTLIAYNAGGSDTLTVIDYITVYSLGQPPYADFSSDFNAVYEGETINYTDYSSGSPTSWLWTFEGGTPSTSSDQNPSVVYNTAGTYAVTLIAYNADGSDTLLVTDYVTVYSLGQPPYADFSSDFNAVYEGETINYTDYSTGSPTSWLWTFEGGTPSTSSDQNPSVVYNTAGTYSVTLIAYNADGSDTLVVQDYVTVYSNSTPVYADFTSDQTYIGEGEVINYYDLSSGNPTSWLWTFEGGSPSTSTDQNPSVTYTTSGWYSVTLIATNGSLSDTITYTDYVYVYPSGYAPTADFTSDINTVSEGNSVQFYDLSTDSPTSWAWTFEGGTPSTSTDQYPLITYNVQGTYGVTLIAQNAYGSDTLTVADYITVIPSTALPNDDCLGAISLLHETTCIPTSGTTVGATQSIPAITCNGYSGDASDDVWYQFTATSTTADIIVEGSPSFDAVVELLSGTCDGTNINCADATADGGIETISETNLVIGETYLIRVYSYGATQDTFTICVSGGITGTAPVADFIADVTTVSEGGTVNFTDLSTNTPTVWTWTFEGGTPSTSTAQNPVVSYSTAGTYDVTLVADNAFGSDTELKVGYITVTVAGTAPVADFSADVTTVSEGGTVNFTDLSTNTPTGWTWTFEGGTPSTSTAQNPTVLYATAGTYDVTLVADNAFGSDLELKVGYITVTVSTGPANDDCSGAITLTQTALCTPTNGTTVGATQSIPAIVCNGFTGNADDDVWYKFVATSTNPEITVVGTTGFDAVIELLSGACNGTNISCSDVSGDAGTETIVSSGLTVNNTYYIRVYDYYTSPGDFTICVYDGLVEISQHSQKQEILIYPNPTKDIINIANALNDQITIYNLLGDVIYKTTASEILTKVDMSNLPAGNYLIQVISREETIMKKIVLSR